MSDAAESLSGGINGERQPERVMPADCNPIEGVVDPFSGGRRLAYVRTRTLELTARKGMGAALELAHTVRATLRQPHGVYRGVCDYEEDGDGDENWFIFGAVPSGAYDLKTGKLVPVWKGEVFLVFLDEDWIVRWWHWTDADPKNNRRPKGFDRGRFRETLL